VSTPTASTSTTVAAALRAHFEHTFGRIANHDWLVIEHVTRFHPEVATQPDPVVPLTALLANWHGATPSQRLLASYPRLLKAANDAAEAAGALPNGRMTFRTEEFWGFEEWDENSRLVQNHPRTLAEIEAYLVLGLGPLVDAYFVLANAQERSDVRWPVNSHWIAVFPITGGSEGHYIHVEAIARDGSRQLLYLGKTFKGMDHAWQIARKLGDLLHV